jgi:hypothetical protein
MPHALSFRNRPTRPEEAARFSGPADARETDEAAAAKDVSFSYLWLAGVFAGLLALSWALRVVLRMIL